MRLFDSFENGIREFIPVKEGYVHMYVCGLTPYDNMHIGHLRTYVFFDVVRRYFEHKGYTVIYVQNITDVEDKIFNRAKELNVHPLKLADDNARTAYYEMEKMNILRPTFVVKVSEEIPAIISLIQRIIDNGYAYVSGGDVYFSISKFHRYGRLSRQKLDELMAGVRVEPGENKRNPLDFALWKKSDENVAVFNSPWSIGRPGWHIECSAISTKYLGETIDIHGGGRDLIFPHHENEIAQSESATGKKFVNYWMHTGFLTINGEKMSKSLGNFITAADVLGKYSPNVIRWYMLTRHYRSPIDFSYAYLDEIVKHFERIDSTIEFARVYAQRDVIGPDISDDIKRLVAEFHDAMDDDFDTPRALASVNEIVRMINLHIRENSASGRSIYTAITELINLLTILGFSVVLKEDGKYVKLLTDVCKKYSVDVEQDLFYIVEGLFAKRDELRKEKRYAESDEIRAAIKKAGIVVEDMGKQSIWRRG
ncbi:MAG: cysteine--tRNA ligase [Candidatus Micrarchaeia archaeon]